jgi:hypothetical protein
MLHLRRPNVASCHNLSPAENAEAGHIDWLLLLLDIYVRQFQTALDLFTHAEALIRKDLSSHTRFQGWLFIAARDAALTIYHFGHVLQATRGRIRRCPTLKPFYRAQSMRLAHKLYEANFGHIERIRHAIGHTGEMISTPENLKRMQGGGQDRQPSLIISHLSNRKFQTTHDGELFSFEIADETLKMLERITGLAYEAFAPIEEAALARGRRSP